MLILIAEDFEQFRKLLAAALELDLHVKPVCVSDGADAILKAAELQPDLVLLDIGLPKVNGIEAARQIRQLSPQSKILFVSMISSLSMVEEAFRNGGDGYLLKTDAGTELMAGINAVLSGERFVSSTLALPFPKPSSTQPSAG